MTCKQYIVQIYKKWSIIITVSHKIGQNQDFGAATRNYTVWLKQIFLHLNTKCKKSLRFKVKTLFFRDHFIF